MALIDELVGILGQEAVDKINASPVGEKIARGYSITEYLDRGDVPPAELLDAKKPEPKVETNNTPRSLTLDEVTRALNTVLADRFGENNSKLFEEVDNRNKKFFETEGAKFRSEVRNESINLAGDITDVSNSHLQEFGERLDRTKFADFVKDKQFKTVKEAHDSFVSEQRTEKRISEETDKRVKHELSQKMVAGVTPSSSSGVMSALKKFGSKTDKDGKTNAERYQEAFEKLNSQTAVQ